MKLRIKRLLWIVGAVVAVYMLAHVAVVPLATAVNRSRPTGETPEEWGYHYTTIVINGPRFSRVMAWYIGAESPKGQVIVVAHNGGNKSVPLMRWTASVLLDSGYSVVLTDPRGQGESGGIKTYGPGEAVDIANLVAYLSEKYPALPIGGLGYSLGAAALIRAMGLETRLLSVVAFAPYSRLDGELIRQELMYQTGNAWSGRGIWPALLAASFSLWAFHGGPVPQPVSVAATLEERGLLLMHFEGDPELPVRYSREIYASAGDSAEFIVYEGDRHIPLTRSLAFEAEFTSRVMIFFDRWLANTK